MCGAAIEVPLRTAVAVLLVFQSDVMATPGAKISMQAPKFENTARTSLISEAAAVNALGVRAGETVHAFLLALPAAIAYATPAAMEFVTAWSSASKALPPRLMFATAGLILFAVTQLTPAITPEKVPKPLQSSTRTECSVTALAIPYVAPPIVPETCVPWPLQSVWPKPSPIASKPNIARPPKSVCERRI